MSTPLFHSGHGSAAIDADVEFARPLRLMPSDEVRVTCLSGTAWLTRDGHLADIVLSAGDSARVLPADDALVVGMPCCRLRIVTQAPMA
jgi:hypothetical protein